MLGMKNHFDISGSIEIREVDVAGVACTSIEAKDNVKYLGAVLDQCLSGENMVTSIIQKANVRLKFLYKAKVFKFWNQKAPSYVNDSMPFRLCMFLLVPWHI